MRFPTFIRKALSEDNGNPSSMRLNVSTTIWQWAAVISFGFVWCCIYHPEFILAYLASILAGLLGLLGIKAYQKNKEEKVVTNPEVQDETKS